MCCSEDPSRRPQSSSISGARFARPIGGGQSLVSWWQSFSGSSTHQTVPTQVPSLAESPSHFSWTWCRTPTLSLTAKSH